MCNLNLDVKKSKVKGWKIVAVDNTTGIYYSPATGLKYEKDGNICVPYGQKQIGNYFANDILNKEYGWAYKKNMVGRSCAFVDIKDADDLAGNIIRGMDEDELEEFTIKIIKVELSVSIMSGTYGIQSVKVYGAKHMKFI